MSLQRICTGYAHRRNKANLSCHAGDFGRSRLSYAGAFRICRAPAADRYLRPDLYCSQRSEGRACPTTVRLQGRHFPRHFRRFRTRSPGDGCGKYRRFSANPSTSLFIIWRTDMAETQAAIGYGTKFEISRDAGASWIEIGKFSISPHRTTRLMRSMRPICSRRTAPVNSFRV